MEHAKNDMHYKCDDCGWKATVDVMGDGAYQCCPDCNNELLELSFDAKHTEDCRNGDKAL